MIKPKDPLVSNTTYGNNNKNDKCVKATHSGIMNNFTINRWGKIVDSTKFDILDRKINQLYKKLSKNNSCTWERNPGSSCLSPENRFEPKSKDNSCVYLKQLSPKENGLPQMSSTVMCNNQYHKIEKSYKFNPAKRKQYADLLRG